MIDHNEAHQLIENANQLYDQFVALNTYHFYENTLEYFFIEKTEYKLNDDIESVREYFYKVLKEIEKLLEQFNQFYTSQDIIYNFEQRMRRIYQQIQKLKIEKPLFHSFDFQKALNEFLKPIVATYFDYIDYFQSCIDSKNKQAVDIIQMINEFMQTIGIFSISCHEGDEWDELVFNPQTHVSDNMTMDQTKEGCVHHLYAYAYAIDVDTLNKPYILHKGEVSIWKRKGE